MHAFIPGAVNNLPWRQSNALVDDFHTRVTAPHRDLLCAIRMAIKCVNDVPKEQMTQAIIDIYEGMGENAIKELKLFVLTGFY